MLDERLTDRSTEAGDLTVALLRALWKHAAAIVVVAIVAGILGVGLSFLVQPQFTATATLLPQATGSSGGLIAAIGSFANIALPGDRNLEALYPTIIRSSRILDGIITGSWPGRDGEVSLYEIFDLPPATGSDSLDAARRLKQHLGERVLAFHQDKQGVMELSVTVPGDPVFAAALANAVTDSLENFIVGFNEAQARERLQYVQRRLDEVAAELQTAESLRARFREENRAFVDSPRLMQRAGELEREVQALTAVWVELIKQLEIAKLDDNRERFSLEVLDRALPPLHRSRPNRAAMGIIGFVLGGLAASVVVIARRFAAVERG
ncbi:MAG: Wzz/FepE/Etk N-terminal domain-containing protein [Candidatus Krumholzibacteriia bacterium]